jgi:hypothetical protein
MSEDIIRETGIFEGVTVVHRRILRRRRTAMPGIGWNP